MFKIVKKVDGVIRKIAENKTAVDLITKEVTKDISLAVLEAANFSSNEYAKYGRIYYVLEGILTLSFEGNAYSLEVGDSCFIAKGTAYKMSGTFKTIVINQPAYGTLI